MKRLMRKLALVFLLVGVAWPLFRIGADPAPRSSSTEDFSGPRRKQYADAAGAGSVSAGGGAGSDGSQRGDQWRDEEVAHTLRLLESYWPQRYSGRAGRSFSWCGAAKKPNSGRNVTEKWLTPARGSDRWRHEPSWYRPFRKARPPPSPATKMPRIL